MTYEDAMFYGSGKAKELGKDARLLLSGFLDNRPEQRQRAIARNLRDLKRITNDANKASVNNDLGDHLAAIYNIWAKEQR